MRAIRSLRVLGFFASILVVFAASSDARADVIQGTPGNDSLSGTNSSDTIWAYGGNDYAQGLQGVDTLHMADGVDAGHGNPDTDYIYGGANGVFGRDDLYGGGGNDHLYDRTTDGSGEDENLYGEDHNDDIQMDDGDGLDYGFGGPGTDTRTKDAGDIWQQD